MTGVQTCALPIYKRKGFSRNGDFAWLGKNLSVQLNMGPGMYFGDLSLHDGDPFTKVSDESKLSGSLVISNKFLSFMALQSRVMLGRYKADNTTINRRLDGYNYMFGMNLMVDLVNLMSFPREMNPDIYIYVYAGLGLMRMRPSISNLTSGEEIPGISVQEKAELVTYYGIGANKKLGGNWDMALEMMFNSIPSDKLDGITTTEDNDHFVYASIGLKYNLPDLNNLRKYKYRRHKPAGRR